MSLARATPGTTSSGSVSAADSVDGKKDKPKQALAGNFNQLRKLKERSPDTKVLISLGGWTWSDNFSAAAATPESRAALVSSCIDLYLKGNLPVIDGKRRAGCCGGHLRRHRRRLGVAGHGR